MCNNSLLPLSSLSCIMPSSHFAKHASVSCVYGFWRARSFTCMDFQANIWSMYEEAFWLDLERRLVNEARTFVNDGDAWNTLCHIRVSINVQNWKNRKDGSCKDNSHLPKSLHYRSTSLTYLNDLAITRWKSKKVALDTCCYMASHVCHFNEHDVFIWISHYIIHLVL